MARRDLQLCNSHVLGLILEKVLPCFFIVLHGQMQMEQIISYVSDGLNVFSHLNRSLRKEASTLVLESSFAQVCQVDIVA